MRVLVVGTVPPPGGAGAQALARVAASLVASGEQVEVLSPDVRSAAHRSARLDGLFLALRLALAARRFDALVLRIEPGVPLAPTTGRGPRAAALAALGAATSLFGQVTLRLDTPVPIPGGLGGRATTRLWASATRIVVASEDDRDQILAAPGVLAERVEVEEPAPASHPVALQSWAVATDDRLRDSVLALVRARAARDRALNAARAELGGAPLASPGVSGFGASDRPRTSATGVARALGGRAVRVARRLAASR